MITPQYIDFARKAYTTFCIDILGSNDYDKEHKVVYTGGQSYENKNQENCCTEEGRRICEN